MIESEYSTCGAIDFDGWGTGNSLSRADGKLTTTRDKNPDGKLIPPAAQDAMHTPAHYVSAWHTHTHMTFPSMYLGRIPTDGAS